MHSLVSMHNNTQQMSSFFSEPDDASSSTVRAPVVRKRTRTRTQRTIQEPRVPSRRSPSPIIIKEEEEEKTRSHWRDDAAESKGVYTLVVFGYASFIVPREFWPPGLDRDGVTETIVNEFINKGYMVNNLGTVITVPSHLKFLGEVFLAHGDVIAVDDYQEDPKYFDSQAQ